MTNAPETRKTHVIRIFGTNRKGEVLHYIWADVERTDAFKIINNDDNYQGVEHRLKWMDDPNSDDYDPNGNPARVTELVKVCDPENTKDLSDPDEWIPIYRIKQMKSITTQGDNNYQGRQDRYKNDNSNSINEARVVKSRRIEHYDTNIDDAAQAAANSDPSLKVFVVKGDQYQRFDETRDETQYVEHEIPLYAKLRGASSSGASNMPRVDDQGKQFKLLNQYLIDESEPAKLDVVGEGNIDPPYRLDVFQNIINVKFGGLDYQYLLSFQEDLTTHDAQAENGQSWSGASSGASGMGYTVISAGCVAFGYVTDPATKSRTRCFMRADPVNVDGSSGSVYMGTIVNGSLTWSVVFTAPYSITSLSFANDAFFISYVKDWVNTVTRLAVTRDGVDFIDDINPVAGVPAPTPIGNVAYLETDSKNHTGVYTCIASTEITYDNGVYPAFSNSMVWATSRDGVTWSAEYQTDVYGQPGQNGTPTRTTICAGNGIFVAAASYKNKFPEPVPPYPSGAADYVLDSAAVAISTNGKNWQTIKLPGTEVRSNRDNGDRADDTFSVAFIPNRKSADGGSSKGYFVATTHATGGIEFIDTAKVYLSFDGISWNITKTISSDVFHPKYWDAASAVTEDLSKTKIVII